MTTATLTTETATRATAAHPTPAWSAAMREQMRTVWLAIGRERLLFLGLMGLIFLGSAYGEYRESFPTPGNHSRVSIDFDPSVGIPLFLLGLLLPLGVWRGEEPSRRGYLWVMPLDRTRHTLLKNSWGWVWLMIAVATWLLFMLAIAAFTEGDIGRETMRRAVAATRDANGELDFRWERTEHAIAGWRWVVPFTAATITYLLASILVLSSDRPWVWGVGIVIVYMILFGVLSRPETRELQQLLGSIVEGPRFGLERALQGTVEVSNPITLPNGRVSEMGREEPNFGVWLRATALWLALGTAGVLAAARRHQER